MAVSLQSQVQSMAWSAVASEHRFDSMRMLVPGAFMHTANGCSQATGAPAESTQATRHACNEYPLGDC
jgi:hypothetical protein